MVMMFFNSGLGEIIIISLLCVFIFFILDEIGNYGKETEILQSNHRCYCSWIFALIYIIPLCVLVWYAIDYVLFNLAKASKMDGSSERYSFSSGQMCS